MLKRTLGVIGLSLVLYVWAVLVGPTSVRAELPVIDTAAIAQMVQQYAQMAQQLEALLQQVTLLKQQVSCLTGHYGMGALGNSVNGWGAVTWNDIAQMVAQGVNPGDAAQVQAFKEAQAGYATRFPALRPEFQANNPRMNAAYNQTYSDAMTGTALGESTFNQVDTYLSDVENLKGQIDRTDNLKSAMDLNTAVNVRIAQINGEILRMQAAQLHLQASHETQTANGNAAQAEFFSE